MSDLTVGRITPLPTDSDWLRQRMGMVGHPKPAQWHGGTPANAITLLEQAMACAIPEDARLEIGVILDKLKRGAA
jgi:hypothetical protein